MGGIPHGQRRDSAHTVCRLSFCAMKNNEIMPTKESASATRCQANPYDRILVVDDDADIRQVSADVLRRCGYQTETAADGAAAWEALQAKGYDLLITDNHIPKVSGV